jgi:hypothetical protein
MRTLLAVILVFLAGCVQQRTGVSKTEVPGPVLATLEKSARPGKITTIVREARTSETRYIATVIDEREGKRWEVVADGSGKLLYKKEK